MSKTLDEKLQEYFPRSKVYTNVVYGGFLLDALVKQGDYTIAITKVDALSLRTIQGCDAWLS